MVQDERISARLQQRDAVIQYFFGRERDLQIDLQS